MRTSKWTVAWIAGTSTVLAALTLAQTTKPAMPGTNTETYIQHLRDARKLINDAKTAFEKDPVDPANHRKEIFAGLDSALKAIDSEIVEYKGEITK